MSPDRHPGAKADHDVDADADQANMSYPSPGAEAFDAGPFYATSARDGVNEQGEQGAGDHHQDGTEHHNGDLHHGNETSHHLHDDHNGANSHVPRPENLEELQLAAQLGQGLAGANILPATDPNMSVDDTGMRNIMPHPEPEHHGSPFVHDTPNSDHIVQQAMQAPPPMPPHYAIPDGIPPRKRSKVSRACDECRRKKIKCDAQSDTGENPCTSCARSSIRCLFSRVPQKRGPSKGYIKELADRINSIESKLESDGNLTQEEIDRLFSGTERPRQSNGVPNGDEATRKRPFSSISSADFTTPLRQAPWGADSRSMPVSASQLEGISGFGNASLAPAPIPIKADETPSKAPAVVDAEMTDDEDGPEIDDAEFSDVLLAVQPVYPILPTTKERMQAMLAQCTPQLRTAFTLAMQAVGQTTPGDVKQANALLSEWEASTEPRSRAADLVHAQTLVLLITDADWRASSTLPFLLARAVALANCMKLYRFTSVEENADPDSEDMLSLRIWWSIVVLDRWHAAGTGSPSHVPDSSAVVPAGLESIVGEVAFHYIRLSKLLNRIAFVISTMAADASTAEPTMAAILTDYVENFREDLPAHVDAAAYPLVHLAYWHCKLLITMLTPGATPADMMWPAKELTLLLLANSETRSPLAHHFVSLALMALAQLAKVDGAQQDEALVLVKEVVDPASGSVWDGVRDKLGELLRPSSSDAASSAAAAANKHNLQHLADLATAHAPPADAEAGAAASIATGYLETA